MDGTELFVPASPRLTKQERQEAREAAMRLQSVQRRVQRARTPQERDLIWKQAVADRALVGRLPAAWRDLSQAAAESALTSGKTNL